MTAVGDALRAIRSVLLLREKVDGLDRTTTRLAGEIDGLADAVQSFSVRLARLEGFIEGARAAAPAQLPRIEP